MRQLSIEGIKARDVLAVSAAVTATMLGSQCGSLLDLQFPAVTVGLRGAEVVALAALTRLTRLKVCRMGPCLRFTLVCAHT